MFQLKEVEKIASSEKGVVLQAVKDVLKELVDDNLVDSDKIGTSVYFWAFPGKGTCVEITPFILDEICVPHLFMRDFPVRLTRSSRDMYSITLSFSQPQSASSARLACRSYARS